ncbi:MAG: putative enzyme of heme biosynthesis [Proteobacteria bacterium]|nr:putative enzyme of heme biosynthesis [Pseudomonadota bacterium]
MENQVLTPPPVPADEQKHRTGPRWNRIFTSAAIAVLAVLAWQGHVTRVEMRDIQADLARRLADGDKTAQEASTLARQGLESIDALKAKMGGLEAKQEEAQSQYAALETLYAEFSRARDERALNEIEQAVSIAAQQLQLAGNVPAALAALQSADSRLALLDQARFLSLRKLIAADMERLKSLPMSDVSSIALQLETIMGRIDTLPLGFEHSPPVTAKPAVKLVTKPQPKAGATKGGKAAPGEVPADAASVPSPSLAVALAQDLWREFRQLIRVERLDRPDPALLAPGQAAYLRENLRLRLLSARMALMQREGKLFAEDVHQTRTLLQRYFDTQSRPVADTLDELAQIERARLTMNLPGLEETQAALRAFKLGGKR